MADKRVQLALVIHNHQPVGNFDHVIAEACEKAYLPFLRMLLEFPRIRIGLHTSGCLLEWMEQGCPEYFELVRELLKRGQLELLGGGMYEPILPILDEDDGHAQLSTMRGYLESRFTDLDQHIIPKIRGIWLPERVWEPNLPRLIRDRGYLYYTLVDDHHFKRCAALSQIESGYFVTSHLDYEVALLPISEQLRYTMPFQPVEATFRHLAEVADRHPEVPLQVFGDDGEKFGVWPDTHEWVYGRGWLRDFFSELTSALDWVELLLPGEVRSRRAPAGRVFLPCSSYKEMDEWARVDPDAPVDSPPGHWRNYFVKYDESYALYQRMLEVSDEVRVIREEELLDSATGQEIQKHMMRGQCNCAYWHGVFGGLYLNNLRHALNSQLLTAEKMMFDRLPRKMWPVGDNVHGPRFRLLNPSLSITCDAAHGLALSRLDQYDPPFVWTNALTRRKEHYHHKLTEAHDNDEHASIHDRVVVKEAGLEDRLVYDPHPRTSFNCYLAPPVESPEQFLSVSAAAASGWQRAADDYAQYAAEARDDVPRNHRGQVESEGHLPAAVAGTVQLGPLAIRKSAELDGRTLRLTVATASRSVAAAFQPPEGDTAHASMNPATGMSPLQDQGEETATGVSALLGQDAGRDACATDLIWVEFNFNVLTDQADDRYLIVDTERLRLSTPLLCPGATGFTLCDGWQQRQLRLACPATAQLVVYPIYTVSSSEGGFERTYQGSCFMLGFSPAALAAPSGIGIMINIEELGHAG